MVDLTPTTTQFLATTFPGNQTAIDQLTSVASQSPFFAGLKVAPPPAD